MSQLGVGRKKVVLKHGDVLAIARKIGRSTSHVSRVLNRSRESEPTKRDIEALLGVPFDAIELPPRGRAA